MFDKIKRLGTDTAIYGISTIVGRFLTFLLTPFYAHILPVSDVGIVATVFAYIAFLNVVYGYGMESAYMKYTSTLEHGDAKQTFTVPFLSIGGSSLVLSLLIAGSSSSLARLINLPRGYEAVVLSAAWILFLDALAIIPFASLRMQGKARRFAAIRLLSICVNVACNVAFLLVFKLGVVGIFLSGVISSAFALVLLLPTIVEHLHIGWSRPLYRDLLKFGLPYVPAGLATMMIQVIDRPVLEALTNQATVGLYQANYRLGIFMMLVVSMFDFAWRPFFLSHAGDADAKQLFARVLTYFVLLMAGIFLILSLFLEDIVQVPLFWGKPLLPALYWSGLPIVPVVLLAYVCLGISNNMVAGIYIEKKTQHLPLITFIGAGVNIAANFLLIPLLGIMGAALATLLSYAVMAGVLYRIVQRFYPIRYEFERLSKIILSAAIVYALFLIMQPTVLRFGWKIALLLLFLLLMHWMKFFERAELQHLAMLFRRRTAGVPASELPPDVDA